MWLRQHDSQRTIRIFLSAVFMLSLLQAPMLVTAQDPTIGNKSSKQYFEDGRRYLGQNDYQQAIESFKKAIESAPTKEQDYYYYLGLSYYKLGRYQEALIAYQAASQLPPRDISPHYELSKVYWALGNKEAALAEHLLIKKIDPDLAEYLGDFFSEPLPKAQPTTPSPSPTPERQGNEIIYPAGRLGAGVPKILYKERAKYTEIARKNMVQGTVRLSAIFGQDGKLSDLKVVRGVPDGLTRKAMEAALAIRFEPATKDGVPVSVRAQLEFSFTLY